MVEQLREEQRQTFNATVESLYRNLITDRNAARIYRNHQTAMKGTELIGTELIGKLFGLFEKGNIQKRPMVIVKAFAGDAK